MSENFIDHVLFSQFDLTSGNTLEHQYPTELIRKTKDGPDVDMIGDYMIPDGMHKRDFDWTFFFLNRDKPLRSQIELMEKTSSKSENDANGLYFECFVFISPPEATVWEPLGDGINIIRISPTEIEVYMSTLKEVTSQKFESSSKLMTGARLVRFAIPPTDCLDLRSYEEPPYGNLNFVTFFDNKDNTFGVRFFRKRDRDEFHALLQKHSADAVHVDSKDEGNEGGKEDDESPDTAESDKSPLADKPFLNCISFSITLKDSNVLRGGRTHSYCLVSSSPAVFNLALDLQKELSDVKITDDVEKRIESLYKKFNSITSVRTEWNTNLVVGPHLKSLITLYKEDIMLIYNAVLFGYNVIVCSSTKIAYDVSMAVMTIVGMFSEHFEDIYRRAFPYAGLSNISEFENVKGFIVGVNNAIFESKTSMYDLYVDLDKRNLVWGDNEKTKILKERIGAFHEYDLEIYRTQIEPNMNNPLLKVFQDLTKHILLMAEGREEFSDQEARKKEMEANLPRLEIVRNLDEYKWYLESQRLRAQLRTIKEIDAENLIRKISIRKDMSDKELFKIYESFIKHITTEDRCVEFLQYFSTSSGGLTPIAINLFHKSELVRLGTVALLIRLDKIRVGYGLITGLNMFLLLAYERNKRDLVEKIEEFLKSIE